MLALVILVGGLHLWDTNGAFVYDDMMYIVQNPAVNAGLVDPGRYFTDPATYGGTSLTPHYRPLVAIVNAINAGMGGGTLPFKLTQLATHLIAVLGLYGLLTTVRRRFVPMPAVVPLLASAWVGITPFNVEAVHYLTARTSVMCGMFSVLSVWAYLEMRASDRRRRRMGLYAGHLVALTAAVLSKETALAIPAVLLLADWVLVRPTRHDDARGIRFWWPYLLYVTGLAVAFVIMPNVWWVLNYITQVFREEWRIASAIFCLIENIRLMLTGTGLSVTHFIDETITLTAPRTIACAMLVAGLLGGIWWSRRRAPVVAFGLGWYFLLIAPSTFVHLSEVLQENRGYSASFGIAMVVAWLVGTVWQRAGRRRVVVAGLLLVMTVGYGALAVDRQRVWANEYLLWTDALQHHPTSARAYSRLAAYHLEQGDLDASEQAIRKAMELDPTWINAVQYLAGIYQQRGNWEQAERYYLMALNMAPDKLVGWPPLVRLYEQTGQLKKLAALYQQAIRRVPRQAYQWRLALVGVWRRLGEYDKAMTVADAVLTTIPHWPPAQAEKALLFSLRHQPAEAVVWWGKALKGAPGNLAYRVQLGRALTDAGRPADAVPVLQSVLAVTNQPMVHFYLAEALTALGAPERARPHYRQLLAAPVAGASAEQLAARNTALERVAAPDSPDLSDLSEPVAAS